jgi:hypothetical protein
MDGHQLTMRRVSDRVKELLLRLAKQEDGSFNQVSIEDLETRSIEEQHGVGRVPRL